MATFADITRNRNIHDIWSVVRRFTRGRWTEATIPTMPEIIAMLSLTELTEVTIQPGAQSPYLLHTLDKNVKHAVLVYPKALTDTVALQNPAVNARLLYNDETGALTFAFDELPGNVTLIINDMLAGDDADTQATLLNSPVQIQGYKTEVSYNPGDIALFDDGIRKTLIVANAQTQGEFDATKWSVLVTQQEYGPAIQLITQNLQQESLRATAAEQALQDALSAEVSRSTSIDQTLQSDLATEKTRATAAEQVLRQDIASEVTRATAQENQIAQNLSAETTRATAAEQALSQSLQQEITQRQAKDIASVQYNASTNSLQHNRTDGTAAVVAIPVADSNKNGLMSKQTYDQVQDLASIVSELVGKGTRRLTSAAINPEPEPTPDATWQAAMNALWASVSSNTAPVDGDTLISTNSATLWRLATYVAASQVWVYRGADTLSIASPTQLGIVLSTQATDNTMENGGSVFVEQGTGAMLVNGWDNMTGRITSMEAFMNRQAGFATAAQGALADTLSQNAVLTSGTQTIDGVKNFVGTLQIDGVDIPTLMLGKADKNNPTQAIVAQSFTGNNFVLKEPSFDSVALDIGAFYDVGNDLPAAEVRVGGVLYIMDSTGEHTLVKIDATQIDVETALNLKGELKFNGVDVNSIFVSITNAQTVTGLKTFTTSNGMGLIVKNPDIDVATAPAAADQCSYIDFIDSNSQRMGLFGALIQPTGKLAAYMQVANRGHVELRATQSGTWNDSNVEFVVPNLVVSGSTNISTQKLNRIQIETFDNTSVYVPIAQFHYPYTEAGANGAGVYLWGRLGGYSMSNTALVNGIIMNRDTEAGAFFTLGNLATSVADIQVYRQSDNTSIIYLKLGNYAKVDLNIQWFPKDQVTYLFDGSTVSTPTGTKVKDLSSMMGNLHTGYVYAV